MKSLTDILVQEGRRIEDHSEIKGGKHGAVKNIMIVIQFDDDHVHSHIPPIPVTQTMISHVTDQLRNMERGLIVIPGYKRIDGV